MTDVRQRPEILPYSREDYPEKIPDFASEGEARDFYDTHDMSYYWDQGEALDFDDWPEPMQFLALFGPHPDTPRRPGADTWEHMRLSLPTRLVERLNQIAERKKIPYQLLVRQWVEDRLKEELNSVPGPT